MNRHKLRCSNFTIVYYKDNTNYDFFKAWDTFITWLVENKYSCAYIIHDKDEGKMWHTHAIVKLPNQRSIERIAHELNVPINDIEIVKSMYGCYRYLTHKDDLDKYQYDDSEIEFINNFPIPKPSKNSLNYSLYSLSDIVRDLYNNDLKSLQALTFYYLDNDELDDDVKDQILLIISKHNTYLRGLFYEKSCSD